jgi:hypothetical protein
LQNRTHILSSPLGVDEHDVQEEEKGAQQALARMSSSVAVRRVVQRSVG